jgi:pyruvate/2-oxoglutarate dehydrogenase complex dihydrolipoamide acyltransferase (E2) component
MATEQQEKEFAQRMLLRSDAILAAVDQAYIIQERGHKVRAMPTFRPEEISLGKVLGTGGFGIVNEIKGFFLDKEDEGEEEFQTQAQSEEDPNYEKSALMTALIQNNPQGAADATVPSTGIRKRTSEPKLTNKLSATTTTTTDEVTHVSDAHIHYDVREAKEVMLRRAIKCGRGRYALKRLHDDLSVLERARGMIDLAVEAKYLSTVWHPNIST